MKEFIEAIPYILIIDGIGIAFLKAYVEKDD